MGEPTNPETMIDRVTRWVQDHALVVAGGGLVALVAAVTMAIGLAAGGSGDSNPPDDTVSSDTTTGDTTGGIVSAPPPEGSPSGTGTTLPAGEEGSLTAVKIDNAEPARPQIGLDAARWIVETPVEGGITRFLAFFPPGENLVGPVRSARPIDVDLVGLLSNTLVSTGGRPFVLGALTGNGFTLIGEDPLDSPFQTLERPSPHNQFVSLSEIPAPNDVASGFPTGDLPTGESVEGLEVPYATPVTWTYADGAYMRSDGGEPFEVLPAFDAELQPLAVDTVVVMAVNQRSAGYQDANDVEVPTYDVIGSERIWVYHQGNLVEGVWSRASHSDGYQFRTADGDSFGLPEGRTFVHLLPRQLLDG